MTEQDETRLIRYVLDDLPADERVSVEERYFMEDDYHEALLALEAEIVRDWIAGTLPATRAQRFRARLKTDAKLRELVSMVETLSGRHRDEAEVRLAPRVPPPAQVTWARAAFASAGVCVVLIATLGLLVERASIRVDRLQTRVDAALHPAGADRSGGLFNPTFSLQAGVLRGKDTRAPLSISPEARAVNLQLFIPEQGKPVRIALRSADSAAETWSITKDNPGQIEIAIPAGLLSRGDYELTALTATGEVLDSWSFRVVR